MKDINLSPQMQEFQSQIDTLLSGWSADEPEAVAALHTLAYSKILDLTRKLRKKEAGSSLLNFFTTSDMVHEIWVRLASADCRISLESRRDFYKYIQQTMHTFMLDQHKKLNTQKRSADIIQFGRSSEVSQVNQLHCEQTDSETLDDHLSLTMLVEKVQDETLKDVIQMTWYLGLQSKEVASLLNISESTVEKKIALAKGLLRSKVNTELLAG